MAENKRYTNQKKQNSGQDSVIKDDLYLFSIPSGSENDYTLVINPQSKQVRYVLLASGGGGAGTSGTSGSQGSSGSSGQSTGSGTSGSSGSSGLGGSSGSSSSS
jgi:hypothetical protein